MTQIAAALRKAGYVPTAERLRDIAIEVLAVHHVNGKPAQDALYARVLGEADLLCELFAPFRAQALSRFLQWTEDQLRQEAAKEQQQARSGGQFLGAPHAQHAAAARPNQQGGGHFESASRPSLASALLARMQVQQGAQEQVNRVLKLSRLDTFKIDGRPLAALSVGAARGWAFGRGREARWILLMTANMPPDFIVGNTITADEAEMFWRRSRDDADE